jgi:putative ABC transport system permease protein
MFQDLRFGVRMLLKKPGFTLVAVFTLALGIGANTAIFSVVNAVLLRPLPYEHSERLVKVLSVNTQTGSRDGSLSFPNYVDFRAQNSLFEALAAYQENTAALTGDGAPERITGLASSPDLFKVLGAQAAIGRALIAEDERVNPAVVVLSYDFWQRRFGADDNIVGKSIILNGKQKTIVGVMPADFRFPFVNSSLEYFAPLNPKGGMESQRGASTFRVIGRLKPGITLAQAEAEMQAIAAHLEQQYPNENGGQSAALVSAHEDLVGDLRLTLLVLLGAVGFVLLIACANVANLQLARASGRGREMAIREALGASRWRVVRQLLTESLLLAFLGGALGLGLAVWILDLISAFVPADLPRMREFNLDAKVLTFTFITSVLTSLIFGLAPALHAAKVNVNEGLKEGGRGASEGRARHRLRNLLIVAEVALSLVLLAGAGLLIRSFILLRATNPGFNAQPVLTGSITLPSAAYPEDEQQARFYQQVVERAEQLPGVEAAGAILPLPYSENALNISFTIEGQPKPAPGTEPVGGARIITPDYPRAMGIPLISGRFFTEHDTANAPKVILINQTLQRRYFPDEDPVGKRLHLGLNSIDGEIVGVIGDVRDRHLDQEADPEYYVPYQQVPVNTMSLVVRTQAGEPMNLAPSLRAVVAESDKELPLYRVRPMANLVANSIARQRFSLTLLATFAGLALALAGAGIYAVMSFLVAQRSHEIGIRMALGASRRAVFKLIIGQGMGVVAVGLLIGLCGALALTRWIEMLLFEVRATDPLTYIVIASLLAGVALLACFIPARRATKTDPMIALRYE